jgi:radical SAM superfamily enzyme YgiQ (UPF0313 family)
VKNTADLIKRIEPEDVAISIATPYPGTPLMELAKRENWLVTDDWKAYSTSEAVMVLPDFSDVEMREARKYLYHLVQWKITMRKIVRAIKNYELVDLAKNIAYVLPKFFLYLYSLCKFKIHEIRI